MFEIGCKTAEVKKLFGFGSAKKNQWQDVNYMDLVPAHHRDWQEDPQSDRVLVLMPRYTDPILGRLLQPRLSLAKRFIKIPLEGRGSFLWRLVDGKRAVSELVLAFEAQYPDDSDDVPTRVSLYLHAMYDNKFIKYLNIGT